MHLCESGNDMPEDNDSSGLSQRAEGRFREGSRCSKPGRPSLSVITVTFNAVDLLRDTINSIRSQNRQDIEWIVIDGGSTDGTVDLIGSNEDIVDYWVSESDRGMYDALAKGFAKARGEVLCWLNAGDIFLLGALALVPELFGRHKNVDWLSGMQFFHLPGGKMVNCFLPVMFSSDLIRCGAYGRRLPFIQQESTFFRRSMLETVDIEKFRSFKLAGDLYLWYCFAKKSRLTVAAAGLGSFCFHEGQLSEDKDFYWEEADTFLEPFSIRTRIKTMLQKPLQYLPRQLKKRIAGEKLLIWKKGAGWH
jgi:glycosyltransferase involved in cell wall biosynthesis